MGLGAALDKLVSKKDGKTDKVEAAGFAAFSAGIVMFLVGWGLGNIVFQQIAAACAGMGMFLYAGKKAMGAMNEGGEGKQSDDRTGVVKEKKMCTLTVVVTNSRTGEGIQGAEVNVSRSSYFKRAFWLGEWQDTDGQGKARFRVPQGAQRYIKVRKEGYVQLVEGQHRAGARFWRWQWMRRNFGTANTYGLDDNTVTVVMEPTGVFGQEPEPGTAEEKQVVYSLDRIRENSRAFVHAINQYNGKNPELWIIPLQRAVSGPPFGLRTAYSIINRTPTIHNGLRHSGIPKGARDELNNFLTAARQKVLRLHKPGLITTGKPHRMLERIRSIEKAIDTIPTFDAISNGSIQSAERNAVLTLQEAIQELGEPQDSSIRPQPPTDSDYEKYEIQLMNAIGVLGYQAAQLMKTHKQDPREFASYLTGLFGGQEKIYRIFLVAPYDYPIDAYGLSAEMKKEAGDLLSEMSKRLKQMGFTQVGDTWTDRIREAQGQVSQAGFGGFFKSMFWHKPRRFIGSFMHHIRKGNSIGDSMQLSAMNKFPFNIKETPEKIFTILKIRLDEVPTHSPSTGVLAAEEAKVIDWIGKAKKFLPAYEEHPQVPSIKKIAELADQIVREGPEPAGSSGGGTLIALTENIETIAKINAIPVSTHARLLDLMKAFKKMPWGGGNNKDIIDETIRKLRFSKPSEREVSKKLQGEIVLTDRILDELLGKLKGKGKRKAGSAPSPGSDAEKEDLKAVKKLADLMYELGKAQRERARR